MWSEWEKQKAAQRLRKIERCECELDMDFHQIRVRRESTDTKTERGIRGSDGAHDRYMQHEAVRGISKTRQ